jgi:hypothetical protein
MNIMQQILENNKDKIKPCGCSATSSRIHGPIEGFKAQRIIAPTEIKNKTKLVPPEIINKGKSPLIKVEKLPRNLMSDILENIRNEKLARKQRE